MIFELIASKYGLFIYYNHLDRTLNRNKNSEIESIFTLKNFLFNEISMASNEYVTKLDSLLSNVSLENLSKSNN